ncbi:hypothetical protein ACROYT_G024286 [Oculina patagonica]
MADKQGKESAHSPEVLDLKISQTLYEIKELEVTNHELSCLPAKKRVYTRQGAGNLFFLSDRPHVVGQCKKKLEDAKKVLEELKRQKQEVVQF